MNNEIIIRRSGARIAEVVEDSILFGVLIPAGFITDGASVPRLFWWVLDPWGEALYAAIVHDYQLTTNGQDREHRIEADAKFYANLRRSKVNPVRAFLAYLAVSAWSIYYVRRFRNRKSDNES